MKYTDLSMEDVCPMAQKIRDTCSEPVVRSKYATEVNRCVDQLNNARRGLATLNTIAPRAKDLEDLDYNLKSIIKHLDNVIIPNPNKFKTFFLASPSLAENATSPDFFKIKRYSSATNSLFFKPVFSLEQVELPTAMFIYYSYSTKLIFLLLELAHLEYCSMRFYNGIGYVKVALRIWQFLSKRFPSLKKQLNAVHLVITNTSLTGLGILRNNSHVDCGCDIQIRIIIKSMNDLLHVYSRFENEDPLSEFLKGSCCSIAGTFDSLVSSSTEKDLENKILSRQLSITMISALLEENTKLAGRRKGSIMPEDLDTETVCKACTDTEPAFLAYGDQYLIAAKRFIVGCNFSMSSCDGPFSSSNKKSEEAWKFFTECENILRKIPYKELESDGRYKPLFRLLVTARTLLNLRMIVYTIHQLTPEEKVKELVQLRNLVCFDLPKEKILDEQTRNKLLTVCAFVLVLLDGQARQVMSFKGGKYCKRLTAGLQEAKDVAESLLLDEVNATFCRNVLSDFVDRWHGDCEPGREKASFLLERSFLLLQGLTPLARVGGGRLPTTPIEVEEESVTETLLVDKSSDDKEEKSGDDKEEKGGDDKEEKGGDDKEEKGGDDKEEKGGDDKEEKGGDDKEEKGGDDKEEKGGDDKEEKGGDDKEEKGGDDKEEKGGDDKEEKGGDDKEEKGGDDKEEKGGDDKEEKGGDDKEEKGGDDKEEKGGDKTGKGDDYDKSVKEGEKTVKGGDDKTVKGGDDKITLAPEPLPLLVEDFSDRFFKSPRVDEKQSLEELFKLYVCSKMPARVEETVVLRGTEKWEELKDITRINLKQLLGVIIIPGAEKIDYATYERRGLLTNPDKLMRCYKILQRVAADDSEIMNYLVKISDILNIKTEFDFKEAS